MHVSAALIWVALIIYPIRSGPIKLLMLSSAIAAWGGLFLWIRNRKLRWALAMALSSAALSVAFIPDRPPPISKLRSEYVNALRAYEGTRYVWGGESWMGVDCSGIVRSAWIKAHLRVGITSVRPDLFRRALTLWWFDSSAKELALGYGGRTRTVHEAKSIQAQRDDGLQPGDIAVVGRGTHALAYLGKHTWIEADPGVQKVIVLKTSDGNPWLVSSAVFVRWRALD